MACNTITQNAISRSIFELEADFLAHFEAGIKLFPVGTSMVENWLSGGLLFGSRKYVKVPKLHPTIERANFDLGRWINMSRTGPGTLLTTCMRSDR